MLGPFTSAFYMHSYRVLDDSMLIEASGWFVSVYTLLAIFLQNALSRTISIESFKTR